MFKSIISWDIYEIKAKSSPITEAMLRGRIRKFCLDNNRNILVENAEDSENTVRFAVPFGEDIASIKKYLESIFFDLSIKKIKMKIKNPVLSKIKVNLEDRYTL